MTNSKDDSGFKTYMDATVQTLIKKLDQLQETSLETKSQIVVVNSKIDDFSYRLRKLEDSDFNLQKMSQKLELIIQKLEPSVEALAKDLEKDETKIEDLEDRITKIETNWKWVCLLTTVVAGIIGYVLQTTISTLLQMHIH